jgi:hypothetical protein
MVCGANPIVKDQSRKTSGILKEPRAVAAAPAGTFYRDSTCVARRALALGARVTDESSGDDRDRTGNLRVANAALSQLSYVPGEAFRIWDLRFRIWPGGEQTGHCRDALKNPKSEIRNPKLSQWAHLDSNQGPQPYQGCALNQLSYAPANRNPVEGVPFHRKQPGGCPQPGCGAPVFSRFSAGLSSEA